MSPGPPPAPPSPGSLRVAAVQAAPVFLDRAATVDKACTLIREAGEQGARLIAFGEGFLPAHPVWYHLLPATDPRGMELTSALVRNAVTVPGPETDAIVEAARDAGAMVVMGIVERPWPDRSVIFDAQLVVSTEGHVTVRRKLVPAVGERIVFTAGAGPDVRAFDSPWGAVSALLGGENSNPLLTYAMRTLDARIHISAWPPVFNKPGVMQEVMTVTGRAVAYQNTAYVIAVSGAVSPEMIEAVAGTDEQRELFETMAKDPGSRVFAPRGKLHTGPLDGGEGILYADLDLTAGTWAQLVNRQYDRPDLFHLTVDRRAGADEIEFVDGDRDASGPGGADGDEHIRRLIRDRFGDRLLPGGIEELIPYVRDVLRRSEQLAELDLTSLDPRGTTYADDPRTVDGGA